MSKTVKSAPRNPAGRLCPGMISPTKEGVNVALDRVNLGGPRRSSSAKARPI